MELLTIYEQLLDLPKLFVTQVTIQPKHIHIECQSRIGQQNCPTCQQPTTTINQYYTRTIRDLNMGQRQVFLVVRMRQFLCQHCQRYFTESLNFAELGKDHTHRQADFMFMLARKQSYTEVAALVNTPIPPVPSILKRQVVRLPSKGIG